MTYYQFTEALADALGEDVLDAMFAVAMPLPRIASEAAKQVFLSGPEACATEGAGIIREQLSLLESTGRFQFSDSMR